MEKNVKTLSGSSPIFPLTNCTVGALKHDQSGKQNEQPVRRKGFVPGDEIWNRPNTRSIVRSKKHFGPLDTTGRIQ
jgi:hypothetical protein